MAAIVPIRAGDTNSPIASGPRAKRSGAGARLNALYSHDILDTAFEAAFDDIAEIARWLAGATIGLIRLVEPARDWVQTKRGLVISEIPPDLPLCTETTRLQELLAVPDAHMDPRFSHTMLRFGDTAVRAYAGVPLTSPTRQTLGTLCVFDRRARMFSAGEQLALGALGRLTAAVLELHGKVASIRRHAEEGAGQDVTGRLASELLVKPILHFWEHMSVLPKQFGLHIRTQISANEPALALVLEEFEQQTSHIRKISDIVSRIAEELRRDGRTMQDGLFAAETFPVSQWSSATRAQVTRSLRREEENRAEEAEHLAALAVYQGADDAPDQLFDMAVGLALMMFDTPMAVLLLEGGDGPWFKGTEDLDPDQLAFAHRTCQDLMQANEVLVVTDARAAGPAAPPRIRFYAGARFLGAGGQVLGAICVMSPQSRRHFSKNARAQLQVLARMVSGQLELSQLLARERAQRELDNRAWQAREAQEHARQLQEQKARQVARAEIDLQGDILQLMANVASGRVPVKEVMAMSLMAWDAHKQSRVLLISCLKWLRQNVEPEDYQTTLKNLKGFSLRVEMADD